MAEWVVTIDGPAAGGKSTVARRVAEQLSATFLDTGTMYRAVTLAAVRDDVDLNDEGQLVEVIARHRFRFEAAAEKTAVLIDGADVTEAIRAPELTAQVRPVAAAAPVREKLVAMQRAFAARHDRIVTEGRDQGTVAFPEADAKFFLTATATERARRRAAELADQGIDADAGQIRQAIEARDRSDRDRATGPLRPAPDVVTIDTTDLSIDEVVSRVCRDVEERWRKND
jgi:cytidylate kinase